MRISDWSSDVCSSDFPRPDVFTAYYNITEPGNWEGTNVLRRLYPDKEIARRFDLSTEELVQIIEEGKKQLMQIREGRERTGLDDKIMASWNGMMLKGCLDAYRAFGEKRLLERALKNACFIKKQIISVGEKI